MEIKITDLPTNYDEVLIFSFFHIRAELFYASGTEFSYIKGRSASEIDQITF